MELKVISNSASLAKFSVSKDSKHKKALSQNPSLGLINHRVQCLVKRHYFATDHH